METKDIYELIKNHKPNLKESSLQLYVKLLERSKKIADADNFEFLQNPKEVRKKLSEYVPAGSNKPMVYTSVRNTLIPIMIFLEATNTEHQYNDILKEYKTMIDEYNQQYQKSQKENKVDGRQKENMINEEELKQLISHLDKKVDMFYKKKQIIELKPHELSETRAWIFFHILKTLPTRLDYDNMRLINQRTYRSLKSKKELKENYLVKSKSELKFSFNDYKTSSVYGENVVIIPKPLKLKINKYIRLNDYKIGDVVFPMTRNAISTLLTKTSLSIIKKRVSSQILRKYYVSTKYSSETSKEQIKDAVLMGHSIQTQQETYNKDIE
tara:strand:+ start:533 stop:1510 length:978 start_codon:yes stop_codon:yes gene_type:complete